MALNPLAGRRTRAYLLDCIGYLGLAALEVPGGIAMYKSSLHDNFPLIYAASCLPPMIAAVIAARAESGPAGATWGKRRLGLEVEAVSGRPSFGRALLRNVVKISLPWQVGHTVTLFAKDGGFERNDPVTLTSTVLLYGFLIPEILFGILGTGRALHDRAAATQVVPTP